MTDEETLQRAFLSALRKHFKKPTKWFWEQIADPYIWTVPDNQIREVYIFGTAGQNISLSGLGTSSYVIGTVANGTMIPSERVYFSVSDTLTGEIGTPGMADTSLTYSSLNLSNEFQMKTEGYIFSEKEQLSSNAEFRVRWRRRFDLEE